MYNKDIFINSTESIKNVLKKLDMTAEKVLLVSDSENKLLGAITDGDIRRYILSGKSLDGSIEEVYNTSPICLREDEFSQDLAKETIIKHKIELLPILDKNDKVIDFLTWDRLFTSDPEEKRTKGNIDIPVVIMAGGKGTRLDPFTRVLPKPLIPLGEKPVIEVIMDEFNKHGVNKYYLTLNHKSEMIELYVKGMDKDYDVKCIKEETFGGTAASLKLLERRIEDTFIVSNCDVIVKANFEDVIEYHNNHNASLTMLSSIQHYKIPYGVIDFIEGGEVGDIFEKPEYTFTVNTGVYLLNKECLKYIPEGEFCDMTHLIKKLVENRKKVVMYPVNEKDYMDIGQWEDYKKAADHFSRLGTDKIQKDQER